MDDKLWWYIARSSGLTAWVLVSLTVLWGLALSTRVLGNRAAPAWLLDLHRALGALTVVFLGVHLTGLVMDEYSAFGPSDILVPLASSFRPAAVAWGVVAMYLLVAIAVTSWTRRWIPDRLWRWVHASAHGVFVLATVHTLTAGTDAGGLFVKVFAVAAAAAYLFLATYRLLAGRRAPVLAGATTAAASPAAGTTSPPAAAIGTAFHPLTVREVRRETADSVSVSFDVPERHAEDFRFEPGQFLSLRRDLDGTPVTRQYSICSGLTDGELRIAVRRADGGAVSPWIVDSVREGDTLHVAPPAGRFTTALNALARRRVLGVAAGSGITPVLSILKSVLHLEPHSRAVLLVGNKGPDSVMLAGAIDELVESTDGRLTVVHQFSRPIATPAGLAEHAPRHGRHGRLDAERLAHPDFEPLRLGEVDDAFLCGPGGFVSGVRSHLIESGVPADRIRSESFDRGAAPDLSAGAATDGTPVTIVAGGTASDVVQGGSDTILEAGLRAGLDLPYSCMAGSCGTCIARVTSGDVDPGAGELTADERAAGRVLTCQARATGPGTCVSYDPVDPTAVLTAVPGGVAADGRR